MQLRFFLAGILAAMVGQTATAEWFDGGTLHRATVQEWNDRGYSGYNDKLATSADWYITIVGQRAVLKRGSMDAIKPDVRRLMSCVDNAAYDVPASKARQTAVASLAASCATKLGLL